MFLILAEALSPAFLLGYALWNSSTAVVSGADSALLYDSLKAGGRTSEAAKQTGRYAAIQQASQGIASVVGAAIATIDMKLCFTLCGLGGLAATALVLTVKEPPRHGDDGESGRLLEEPAHRDRHRRPSSRRPCSAADQRHDPRRAARRVLRASAAICHRRRAAARIARHHRARRADDHGRGFVARAQSWRTLGPHDHRRGRRRGPPRRDRDPRSVPIGPVSRTHARGRAR